MEMQQKEQLKSSLKNGKYMSVIVNIGVFFLNIIYFIMKLFPVKKKVTMLSRQYNSEPIDFMLLKEQIHKNHSDYEVVILSKRIDKSIFGLISYAFYILLQMKHMANSQILILDTYCIPVSILKQRKQTKIIQIWHAAGAFKKFGYSILDKEEGSSSKIAKAMKMHHNYTYVCTSSQYCLPYFAEAFNVLYEKMVIYPLPHFDLLNDEEYKRNMIKKIFEKYPKLHSNKKIILYAPTFRKEDVQMEKNILSLIENIDMNKYQMIIKLHPLDESIIEDKRVIVDKQFSTTDMLFIADYVVSDYSAIIYEASFLQKPLFFYVFDFDQYYRKRNFYIDFNEDMPGFINKSPRKIAEAIENNLYDIERIRAFREKNIADSKLSYTEDLESFIFS